MGASDFPNLTVVDHPLIRHKMTRLRDAKTSSRDFRALTSEVSMLMAYEATKDLELEPYEVTTPLEKVMGVQVKGRKLALAPVLRAGLGMIEGVGRLVPNATVGHIGLYREHDSLEAVRYLFKIPQRADERLFMVLDPMLATGNSAVEAVTQLKQAGVKRCRFLCMVAAPEGVTHMLERHPDVHIFSAALDRGLDENGYIRPGLGDAGDRLFAT